MRVLNIPLWKFFVKKTFVSLFRPVHGVLVPIAYAQKPPLNTDTDKSSGARDLEFGLHIP